MYDSAVRSLLFRSSLLLNPIVCQQPKLPTQCSVIIGTETITTPERGRVTHLSRLHSAWPLSTTLAAVIQLSFTLTEFTTCTAFIYFEGFHSPWPNSPPLPRSFTLKAFIHLDRFHPPWSTPTLVAFTHLSRIHPPGPLSSTWAAFTHLGPLDPPGPLSSTWAAFTHLGPLDPPGPLSFT